MRGRRVAIALAIVAVVALTSSAWSAERKIVVWDWEPPEIVAKYQAAFNRWQQETGITIEFQQVGWSEMRDKVTVAIAGGAPPDVVRVSSAWGSLVADQGMFLDLRPYLQQHNATYRFDEFYPASVDLWTDAMGRVYALGNDLDMMGFFFNAELFDEAGVERPYEYTWDQWLDAARKLTRDLDGDGRPDQYGFTNWWFHYVTLIWANGGDIFTADRSRSALASPAAREALSFYRRFFELDTVATFEISQAQGYPHSAAHFKAGKIAMAPAGAWMPNYYVWDDQRRQYNFDFDVGHMPLSYAGGRATSLEGSGYAIPANAANKEDAFRFIAFVTSHEWQSEYVTTGFPSRRPVAEMAFSGPQVPENRAVFLEIATYAHPFPKGVEWQGRTGQLVLSNLNQYLTGQRGLEEVLTTIDEQLRPLLQELATSRR